MNKKNIIVLGTVLLGIVTAVVGLGVRAEFSVARADNGTLTVCTVFIDKNRNILYSSQGLNLDTTFSTQITIHEPNKVVKVIQTPTFKVSQFSPNTQILGSRNDAQCTTYSLPIRDYYYRREAITGKQASSWLPGLYNDENKGRVDSLTDFYPLGTEDVADKTIVLHNDAANRRLVILNQYKGTFPTTTVKPPTTAATCANGKTLSFEEAKAAMKNGTLQLTAVINEDTKKAVGTIINKTGCAVPVSQATYKEVDSTLAHQEFFDYTPDNALTVSVAPNSKVILRTNLPSCKAQTSIYYGKGPRSPLYNVDYQKYALEWVVYRPGTMCKPTTPPPPPPGTQTGCIAISGQAYDPSGTRLTQPRSFAYKLDATGRTYNTNATGTVTIRNVPFGPHRVDEIVPAGWNLTTILPANGHVVVASTTQCATVVFKNIQTTGTSTGNLAATCAADRPSALTGGPVIYRAHPTGGTGTYTYVWSGEGIVGSTTTATTTAQYNVMGTKTIRVDVRSGGQRVRAECSVNIIQPTTGGTGGYTSSGGGGYMAPYGGVSVSREPLAQVPGAAGGRVAGVYLSQVPYTGIGSDLKLGLFLSILAAWSLLISYLIVRRKAQREGLAVAHVLEGTNLSSLALVGSSYTTHATQEILPQVSDDVTEALESHARTLEVLVSSDGLKAIAEAAHNDKFTAITTLNRVVEFYKNSGELREDRWLVLNVEKIKKVTNVL